MSLLAQLHRAATGGGRRSLVAAVAGLRSESTAAAAAVSSSSAMHEEYSEEVMEATASIRYPLQRERLRAALALPEGEGQDMELFRLHNSSLPDRGQGHMVLARVTEVGRDRAARVAEALDAAQWPAR